jgi:hypothetical protein
MVRTCTINPKSKSPIRSANGAFFMRAINMTNQNNDDKDVSFLSDCREVCHSMSHPRAQQAAHILDILDDDEASNLKKSVAVLCLFI